jgi:hypothetical protein
MHSTHLNRTCTFTISHFHDLSLSRSHTFTKTLHLVNHNSKNQSIYRLFLPSAHQLSSGYAAQALHLFTVIACCIVPVGFRIASVLSYSSQSDPSHDIIKKTAFRQSEKTSVEYPTRSVLSYSSQSDPSHDITAFRQSEKTSVEYPTRSVLSYSSQSDPSHDIIKKTASRQSEKTFVEYPTRRTYHYQVTVTESLNLQED